MEFGSWLTEEDDYSDVIISSRIRLARNIKGYSFPERASDDELRRVVEKVQIGSAQSSSLRNSKEVEIRGLSEWDSKYYVERRVASPQFAESKRPRLLVIGPRECITLMVNEEDHLRIQCIEAGLGVNKAWRKISALDDELEENLNFSFSSKFGYLTSCPTNLGTGMRVSLFVHLPALTMLEQIEETMKGLPASEIAVRGFYGEGSDSIGGIYQISNQLTLGRAETNIIERVMTTAKRLTELERGARAVLATDDRVKLEDTVYRALGVLSNARIMTSFEAMDLISTIRLGVELGLVDIISRIAINQLLVMVQPAHLQRIYNKSMDAEERDIARAEFIRQCLGD
jgi:protein arginine kinase